VAQGRRGGQGAVRQRNPSRWPLGRGDFEACLALVRASADQLGISLLNSINPWRIEGQKTIVLELLQQLDWNPPDWIALPAGNLGNTAAFGKALSEAFAWGLIPRLPRLLLVQAEGAAPFHASFVDAFSVRHRVKADTVAPAIQVADPASYEPRWAALRRPGPVRPRLSTHRHRRR